MAKEEKTNALRILDRQKINYSVHTYEADSTKTGEEIAQTLGENPDSVFKTLVTCGKPKEYYVFVIPVNKELDLKKAAKAAGEKSISMIPQKELLMVTGYVHGGCSPIGMKKSYPTFFHETIKHLDSVCVSAGRVGMQVQLSTSDLEKLVHAKICDVCAG